MSVFLKMCGGQPPEMKKCGGGSEDCKRAVGDSKTFEKMQWRDR